VAVITGSAQGIGEAIARTFAREGARTVIADINEPSARDVAAAISSSGTPSISVPCDVSKEPDVEEVIRRCIEEFGSVDVMVNNAGIARDATLRNMTLEDFRLVIDVHLQGAWLGTRAAAAVMRGQGNGSIINMSSLVGRVGNVGQTNYSAAKAGIVGLSKSAAKELAHLGIRVNAILPGLVRTTMSDVIRPIMRAAMLEGIPMGRAAEVEDVAKVALFLASDLSSYMTGTAIDVAGGCNDFPTPTSRPRQ
jgi:3-oxoacyl-[acyl-carrier protein] reductase